MVFSISALILFYLKEYRITVKVHQRFNHNENLP